jgi:hypothetical protein
MIFSSKGWVSPPIDVYPMIYEMVKAYIDRETPKQNIESEGV